MYGYFLELHNDYPWWWVWIYSEPTHFRFILCMRMSSYIHTKKCVPSFHKVGNFVFRTFLSLKYSVSVYMCMAKLKTLIITHFHLVVPESQSSECQAIHVEVHYITCIVLISCTNQLWSNHFNVIV